MTFSIIVGLGLDYGCYVLFLALNVTDIFLFSRIVEYRSKGFSDDLSIQLGVQKTGAIVTGGSFYFFLVTTL